MEEIIRYFISTVFITGAIVYLGKRIIELLFSKDLEKFKAQLAREAIEFNIKFRLLHADRAKVIKELYCKVIKTDKSIYSLIKPFSGGGGKPEEEITKEAAASINDLISYYDLNRIFLDEKQEEDLDKMIEICRGTWFDFDMVEMMKKSGEKEYLREWNKAWKNYSKESNSLKQKITKTFRKVIGINQ